MSLTLSCAFATSMATPDHVVIAESLGYERAWLYDSPALYPDVWVQLARAAERTSTIGLGTRRADPDSAASDDDGRRDRNVGRARGG